MDRFIAEIEAGASDKAALAEIGIKTRNTIEQWKRRYPGFHARYVRAKAKRDGNFKPVQRSFDVDFRQRFFGHDTPPHLAELIRVINEQVEIAEREQTRDRRILILLPPEHAKSTLLEEYVVYRIAMDETFRCSIVCATQGQARKRLGAISRMLTDESAYEDLIEHYGPFRSESRSDSKPWTADHITHLRAPAAQRDYTCQALGWTGSIYGDRMDLIVGDDIADLKNQTPAEIDKQWEKLWGEFRSRIRKGGLFAVIGTHMRENDIYTVMENNGFFTEVIKMPAIVREPGTLSEDDPGEALWEDNVSMRELLKLRATDLRMFELMYQQNPVPSVGSIFPLEAIESCYDTSRLIGHIPAETTVVAGIDPSVRNFTSAVCLAVSKSGMRYLVDVWNEKGLTGEGGDIAAGLTEFIVEFCIKYRVRTLALESNSTFALLSMNLNLRRKLNDLGVYVMTPAIGPASGEREELALAQLSGLFTGGLISIPAGLQSLPHLRDFIGQLSTWQPHQSQRKPQDMVKALRMAEHAARHAISGTARTYQASTPHVPSYLRRKVGNG